MAKTRRLEILGLSMADLDREKRRRLKAIDKLVDHKAQLRLAIADCDIQIAAIETGSDDPEVIADALGKKTKKPGKPVGVPGVYAALLKVTRKGQTFDTKKIAIKLSKILNAEVKPTAVLMPIVTRKDAKEMFKRVDTGIYKRIK